ncbi:sensor domain-containing diguanylate cyclase [Alteromonas genovensis]|uniref:sensor domain-containing diguanylate cyclase n=1 Tax=Alteromonas genovensis TaxID=471225 RepID=UPI002FDF73D3
MTDSQHSHFNFSMPIAENYTVISPVYEPWLIFVSILIAISASYIAFVTAHRVSHNEFAREANVWRICAAVFLGIGIWSMHFVGMLAYQFGIPITYNTTITLFSMLPAILASYIVVSSQQLKSVPFIVRSILMGAGIGSMHYVGMMAMQTGAVMVYDPWLFSLSVAVAVLLSGVALYVDEHQKASVSLLHSVQTLYASIVMGLAISGMHYIGMYAMYVVDTGAAHSHVSSTPPEALIRLVLAVVIVASLALLGLIEYRSRVLASARLNSVLNCVQEGFINFGADGKVNYINPAAVQLFGIQQNNAAQLYVHDLIVDEVGSRSAILSNVLSLIATQTSDQVTERLTGKHSNGDRFPISVTITHAVHAEQSFVCTVRDLTDLNRQEVFTQSIFDNLPLAIIVKNATDLSLVNVNIAAQKILGKPKAELIGANDFDIFNIDDAARITKSDTSVLDTLIPAAIEDEAVTIDGKIRYLTTKKTPIFGGVDKKTPRFLLTVIEDVTDLRATRQALEHANKRMAMAADAAQIGFWEWDAESNEIIWDEWMHRIYEIPETQQFSDYDDWVATLHPEDIADVSVKLEEAFADSGEFHTEFRALTSSNEMRYIKVDGACEGAKMFGINMDITARVLAEKEAKRLSLTDALTELANRSALLQYFEREVARNLRNNTLIYCLYIDLDKFKPINDTYGHHAGDEVLIQVAKRLVEAIRPSDCAARIGGDEFVVILSDIDKHEDATHFISRIHNGFTAPIQYDGVELSVGASLGVSYYPTEGATLDELLSAADKKMYETKRSR